MRLSAFHVLMVTLFASTASAGILEMIPEARKLPAPDWVRAGGRITYYVAVGTGTAKTLVRDPDGEWKLKDEPGTFGIQEASNAGSGHGYLEVQITAADPRQVALQLRYFVLMDERTNGPPKPAGETGLLSLPGESDYWVHPKALQALLRRAARKDKGLLVGRMEYGLDGKQVKAIAVKIGKTSYIYDEASGVLLQSIASAATTAKDWYIMPNGEKLQGHASTTYMIRFRGFRRVSLPWAAGPMPAWLTNAHTMVYAGETVLQAAEGLPPPRLPVTTKIEFLEHGAAWVRYRATQETGANSGVPQLPSRYERVSGPGQLGGLWIAPAELAKLKAGQVLDGKDKWTQMTARVAQVGPVGGTPAVVIAEEGPMGRLEYVYDRRRGALIQARMVDSSFHTTTTLRLQSIR